MIICSSKRGLAPRLDGQKANAIRRGGKRARIGRRIGECRRRRTRGEEEKRGEEEERRRRRKEGRR